MPPKVKVDLTIDDGADNHWRPLQNESESIYKYRVEYRLLSSDQSYFVLWIFSIYVINEG